ncbi:O-antigen ligase family protein [Micrococcus lylae]|uniref:O-antigen ligase family protein n=1 Tax=Micrococcus lylae TaxID=1273 RepID=UPI0021A69715|nr:O-antigen ligase family protein [Micrococcus lylae]MCT2006772.1 O-antigen ligase family protein [Micrococcus lylae]MCT2070694.1 O-antigen ligase family protein [Micrococcus lylae]
MRSSTPRDRTAARAVGALVPPEAQPARHHASLGLVPDGQAAWTRSPWNPLVTSASPRLFEAVLAIGLVMEAFTAPGLPIPFAEFSAILLILLASFRQPRRDLSHYGVLALVALALVAYLVAVTVHNDLDPTRRATRITLLILLIYAIASERIDIKGVLYGMTAGALINVPLFYAGLAPDTYGGYLTGFLGDKNVSGLFYALLPVLLVATMQRMGPKLLVLGAGFALTFLTGSRTSMAALLCAVAWILVSPYLGRVLRIALAVVMGWFVSWAEENLADLGIFGDRTGTDWFRAQIQEASAEKVADTSFFGQGLSTAFVDLDGVTMFFHNSYLGLLVEGGWPFLVVVVGAYLWWCLRPFARTHRSPSRVAVEGAALIVLVTSLQLGEVFITIFGAVVLGCGLLLSAQEDDETHGASAGERAHRRKLDRIVARSRRAGR